MKHSFKSVLALMLSVLLMTSNLGLTAFAEDFTSTPDDSLLIDDEELFISDGQSEDLLLPEVYSEDIEAPVEEAEPLLLGDIDLGETDGLTIEPEEVPEEVFEEAPTVPFDQTVTLDGVTFTVTAAAGAFPEGAALRVQKAEGVAITEAVEAAIGAEGVYTHHLYCVEVLDSAGNVILPDYEQDVPVVRVSGMNLPDNARVALYDEYVQGAYEINAEVDINADAIEFSLVDVTVYDIITIEPIQEQPADEAEPTGQGQAEQPTDEATGEDAAEGEPTDEEPTGEDQAEQTADEPTEEEIIIEEPTDQKSAPEVQSVTVTFATEPVTAVVTVYPAATEEVPVPESIPAQEDGSFLLFPGEYTYSAEAEGYVSVEFVPFIVAEESLTISVILEAEEVELAPVAFDQSKTVGCVVVTVKAEPGVFPEGAALSVELVPVYQQAQADAAVEELRDEDVNVALSYTFDIKVIDPATGEEIQPADGQTVNVSFALAEVADENLETQVYHVTEEETTGELTAEALDVTTEVTPETGEETTATVETDGFSIYQVEFTYNKLEYVLPGDTSVAMSEILTALGLSGEVTAVEISDTSLFSASNETGEWIVTAHQAFSTTEWMKVTINDVVYEIAVTDDPETVSVTYVDANGETQTCASATILTDSSTSLSAGWYVVNDDVTIADRISVSGTVNLILADGKTLTASKGITVGSDATLNVYAQTNDEATMGALVADATNDSANWYAGIGGVEDTDAGTITINGGQINAYGWCAAGIGSGGGTSTVGTITINGGVVTAQDNAHYGAGIGGGMSGGKASTINLNGGVIHAACIGSGWLGGDCSITVNISDGVKKIVATPVEGGACIGSGKDANGSVTVNFKSGGNNVTGDAKDAVFYDSGEGSERRIYVKASSHTVTVNNDLKANITSDKEYALTGENVTLTLDASVDATTLKVNDGAVSTTDAGNRQYTFTMPDGNVTVTATLLQTYTVTLPANMEVVSVTNAADAGGKYITGTVVTFKASFPYAVSNVSDGTNTLTATDGVYSVTIGTADITITADFERSSPIDLSDAPGNFAVIDSDVLTGSTSHTVTIADGASITLNNAAISGGIVCEGSATITLVGTNSVTGIDYQSAGIQIGGSGTTLTIRGDGTLTATGGNQSAGIGLSRAWDPANDVIGGDIVIEGGNITANGGSQWGAGIGTGVIYGHGNAKTARIGNITIKGGSVKATGGSEADGIGTGYTYNPCTNAIGTVTIYDGIDKVDTSSIKDFASVVYKHGDDDVTANKIDYFTIGEDGSRRLIVQKPVIAEIADQTYIGSEIKPEPQVTIGSLSLTKGTDYAYSYTSNTNVGTATVKATFQGDYASLGYVERTFTIGKATPTVTAPTPIENLVYTGSAQTLVTAGSADFGTLVYSLEENGTYSADIPTATDTGDYTVYYKVEASDNWNAVDAAFVTVTIAPRTYTVSFDANGGEGTMEPMQLTYDGDWTALTANTFTRTGYGFKGWNTEAGGTGPDYDDEGWVRNLTTETSIVLYAQWGEDIAGCTATVPDQTMAGYSYIYYKFEAANSDTELAATMGVVVKDGDDVLTLGTDYEFGNVTFADGSEGMPANVGDECLLEIKGKGKYAGSLWTPFTITVPDISGTWGDNLTWAFHAGTLTISGTGEMNAASDNSGYPWFSVASYVTAITISEGVTSVANAAFGGTPNVNPYGKVTSVTLPTTLTTIGDDAFAYMTALESIDLTHVTAIGGAAFNQCASLTVTVPATVTTMGSGAFAGCKSVTYAVVIGNMENGTVTASPTSAAKNATITLTATPNTGYMLESFTVTALDGQSVTVNGNQFTMPDCNVTVTATFKRVYTVTFDDDAGCNVTVTADYDEENGGTPVFSGDSVPYGTVLTVTATAKAGYTLTTTPDASYTVTGDLTITAASEALTYTLTLNHENGAEPTVSVADLTAIPYGTNVTVSAGAASEGYEFIGWYQTNGKLLTSNTSYSIAVYINQTIEARYQTTAGIVTFMANEQVFTTFTGSAFTESDMPTAIPSAYYGQEFAGWDKTAAEIDAMLKAGGNITVIATYRPIANAFTVTIYNGESESPETVSCTESTKITRTAQAVTGKNFGYWTLDGERFSYNTEASFTATKSCTLTAVYTADVVEATGTASIRTASYNLSTKKLTINVYLTVPDGSTITAAGLVAASGSGTYDPATELTTANADYNKSLAAAVGKCAPVNYTWNKGSVNPGDIWYVRAHIAYTDGNGDPQEVYSERLTIHSGTDYDYSEKGTATIRIATYNPTTKKATFNAYLTVPDNAVIVKAGLVAASGANFDPATAILTASNADYVKSLAAAVGKCAPVNYTWNKSNVNVGDTWYARAYLVYTLNGLEHTIYGSLVTLTAA